jgi:molybdenum cofactor synthesis domain-containing protein
MFRRLMSFDEAKKVIAERLKPEAVDIPPFSRSTVDGFAVQAESTFGAEENQPVTLSVCGVVSIGELPKIRIGKGEAAEIVTGAPVPNGTDAVVMMEDTDRKDGELRVYRAVTKDGNIMKKGSDIRKGETVLKAGRVLGASEIGVLAALGLTTAKVFTIPVVAVLSTGGEVTELGKKLPAGKIYDINAYSLCTAVRESGGKPVYLGVVPDDEAELRRALENALASADMVLTSGGVSVGPHDLTPKILNSLGKPGVFVNGIAVKPGKPTTVARVGEKPVFALPGHPASALLQFHLLARPVIQVMSGRTATEVKSVRALAAARMFSAKGRRTFIMVKLKRDVPKGFVAEPVETGASGAITTLAKADGFVEIPANQQFIDAGEEVTVGLLKGAL